MDQNANNQQKEKLDLQNNNAKANQEYMKGRENIKSMTKGKEQKSTEKQHSKHSKSHQNKSYKSNLGIASSKSSRYGRNATRSTNPSEILAKSITTKRIETIEDIQADIERIDKEIQFEIKQIKAIKLGI